MRWFEDFTPGQVIPLGSYVLQREEIIEFARRYDPQPFHLDEAAARASDFGGHAASGGNTAAAYRRIHPDAVFRPLAAGPPKSDALAAASSRWNGWGS